MKSLDFTHCQREAQGVEEERELLLQQAGLEERDGGRTEKASTNRFLKMKVSGRASLILPLSGSLRVPGGKNTSFSSLPPNAAQTQLPSTRKKKKKRLLLGQSGGLAHINLTSSPSPSPSHLSSGPIILRVYTLPF